MGYLEFVMSEHDIEYPIDYRESEEADINLETHGTNTVTEIIALKKEIMCAKLAQDPANYATSSKIALAGAAKFSDPSSDPIGVIGDAKEAISDAIVKDANTLVMGKKVYEKLKTHPQLVEKIKYSMKGVVTLDIMKEIFEVKNIVIGKAMQADDKKVKTRVWGDNIILAYVTQTEKAKRTEYEPTYGYTFRKKGNPVVDTYEEGGKLKLIRNTDIFVPKIVGADAGYLITGAL